MAFRLSYTYICTFDVAMLAYRVFQHHDFMTLANDPSLHEGRELFSSDSLADVGQDVEQRRKAWS